MVPMRNLGNRSQMPRTPKLSNIMLSRSIAVLVASIAGSFPSASASSDLAFKPRISVGQHWTDNVRLAPDGQEESERATELRPGFSLVADRPRVKADIDYELQAFWFADNSEFDDAYHKARGTANFEFVPQSVFMDLFVRYDQQNVDPGGRLDFSNLFITDNRTDTLAYVARPYHVGRWGDWAESLVRYEYGGIRFLNTDSGVDSLQDSDTQAIMASLGSPQARAGRSWEVSGRYTVTEFDEAPDFAYARMAFDAEVPVSLRTRGTITAGQESDVEKDPSAGRLDSTFWFIGLVFEPSSLEQFTARVGERFFGTAWEFNWTRSGTRGEASVVYTEEPTTSSGLLGADGVFVPDFWPGGVPALDTRVFLAKSLYGRASYKLTRSEIGARIYANRFEYGEDAGGTDKFYGAALRYEWELAHRTKILADIDREWRSFGDGPDDSDLTQLMFSVRRQLSRTFSGTLSAGHVLAKGEETNDYSANWISLFVTAAF